MFSGPMATAWEGATVVALVAGVVGFFTVLRGSAFAAHALPNGAFAGAAGASLIGANTLLGLGVFAVAGAFLISGLGRKARSDVATALAIVTMLGLGALFLSMTTEYSAEIFSLLFGEPLGVATTALLPTAALSAGCIAAVAVLYRPLLLSSVAPEVAEARGISAARMQTAFLLILAVATSVAVPVVGALLIFTLLISPASAARRFTSRPGMAIGLTVALALATVWAAIAVSYWTNLPIGFFVGGFGALVYAVGQGYAAWRRRTLPPVMPAGVPSPNG